MFINGKISTFEAIKFLENITILWRKRFSFEHSPTLNCLLRSKSHGFFLLPLETMKLPIAFAIPQLREYLVETPFPSPFPYGSSLFLSPARSHPGLPFSCLENGTLLNPFTFL